MFIDLIGFQQLSIFGVSEHHTFRNFLDGPSSVWAFDFTQDTIFFANVSELLFQFLSNCLSLVFCSLNPLLLLELPLYFFIIYSFISLILIIFLHVFFHLRALHVLLNFSLVVVHTIIMVNYFAVINDHQIMHDTAPDFGILRLFQSTFQMVFGFLVRFVWVHELR